MPPVVGVNRGLEGGSRLVVPPVIRRNGALGGRGCRAVAPVIGRIGRRGGGTRRIVVRAVGRVGPRRVVVALGQIRGRHQEGTGKQALHVTDPHPVGGRPRPTERLALALPVIVTARFPSATSVPCSGAGCCACPTRPLRTPDFLAAFLFLGSPPLVQCRTQRRTRGVSGTRPWSAGRLGAGFRRVVRRVRLDCVSRRTRPVGARPTRVRPRCVRAGCTGRLGGQCFTTALHAVRTISRAGGHATPAQARVPGGPHGRARGIPGTRKPPLPLPHGRLLTRGGPLPRLPSLPSSPQGTACRIGRSMPGAATPARLALGRQGVRHLRLTGRASLPVCGVHRFLTLRARPLPRPRHDSLLSDTRSDSSWSVSSVRADSPEPRIASARARLNSSISAMRSSTVPSVMRRWTWTGWVWPMR